MLRHIFITCVVATGGKDALDVGTLLLRLLTICVSVIKISSLNRYLHFIGKYDALCYHPLHVEGKIQVILSHCCKDIRGLKFRVYRFQRSEPQA